MASQGDGRTRQRARIWGGGRRSNSRDSGGGGGIQVVIGGEDSWQELKEFSMVLARYGVPGYATGALGVFGPQRMAYGRAISTVRHVASLMSGLMTEFYLDQPATDQDRGDPGRGDTRRT